MRDSRAGSEQAVGLCTPAEESVHTCRQQDVHACTENAHAWLCVCRMCVCVTRERVHTVVRLAAILEHVTLAL